MVAVWVFVVLIGVVCGLRSLTGPAVVSWGAHLGWLPLAGSPLAFLGHPVAVALFTIFALCELVADKLPKTPARTSVGPLIVRIICGSFCGTALALAGHGLIGVGAVLGAIGAVIGAFGGYACRHAASGSGKLPDLPVALLEDLVAVGGGLFLVSRF